MPYRPPGAARPPVKRFDCRVLEYKGWCTGEDQKAGLQLRVRGHAVGLLLPRPIYLSFDSKEEGYAYCAQLEALLGQGIVAEELVKKAESLRPVGSRTAARRIPHYTPVHLESGERPGVDAPAAPGEQGALTIGALPWLRQRAPHPTP